MSWQRPIISWQIPLRLFQHPATSIQSTTVVTDSLDSTLESTASPTKLSETTSTTDLTTGSTENFLSTAPTSSSPPITKVRLHIISLNVTKHTFGHVRHAKIPISQVPKEVLKTAAFGLGFQHLPRGLANVNAWNTMFDPYIVSCAYAYMKPLVTHWQFSHFWESIRFSSLTSIFKFEMQAAFQISILPFSIALIR